MHYKFKPLREQVIVITGASSGIGLATAQAAAKQGARVVLAARNGEALARIEREINSAGGQAISVAADVGRRDDVGRVVDEAVRRFGGFDTWVNDAGASSYGRLEEVSEEDLRRIMETNFWGTVYGSLVAAGHLKQRGGALVNVGSILSDMSVPLQGMYCASKHAVKGFTDALRIELEEERAPVSVTLIKPSGIDTPFPQHAKNYLDSEPKLPDPVYLPEEVAAAILHAATHAQRDIYVGGGGRAMVAFQQSLPAAMDWVSSTFLSGAQKRGDAPRHPEGALQGPGSGGRVRGEHPNYVLKSSVYTQASMHPLLTGALVVGTGVLLTALVRTMSRA